MKNITVFCASSPGHDPKFLAQATLLGNTLAQQQIGLVYGGAKVGLMGAVADGALEKEGEVIGVLPSFLRSKEIAHEGLTQLIITNSMHERKMKMNDLSDGVIALPGGFGTFEELFEMLTWAQLGLHQKPIGLLNYGGFYEPLVRMIQHMADEGFLSEINKNMLLVSDNITDLLYQMKNYVAPKVPEWIEKENT